MERPSRAEVRGAGGKERKVQGAGKRARAFWGDEIEISTLSIQATVAVVRAKKSLDACNDRAKTRWRRQRGDGQGVLRGIERSRDQKWVAGVRLN